MVETVSDKSVLAKLAARVAKTDPMLENIYDRLGPPPLWGRPANLQTLVHIILEQQVSLASGRAALKKLKNACDGRINAKRLIELGPSGMRDQARLTRQKSSYIYALAEAVSNRDLVLKQLESLPDEQVRDQLTNIKGIGRWTSDVYLVMALKRADVLPLGDLALELEFAKLLKRKQRPTDQQLLRRAKRWQPYRAVAARMLWHSYLDRLGRHDEI